MLRVNPVMLDAFRLYSAPKNRHQVVTATTLAHRIVYAQSMHKGIDLYYLDNADKLRCLVVSGESSLAEFERNHGAGFTRVNRNLLVNTVAITGVFRTTDKEHGCSLVGTPTILPISRRRIKDIRLAFESVNHGV